VPETTTRPPRLLYAAIGVVCALIGLLPWILTGMRLPLQNLWALQALPEDMPFVLLPFSQYSITTVIGVIVTAWVLAGAAARTVRPGRRRSTAPWAAMMILLVQLGALTQTALTVHAGLAEGEVALAYLLLLTGGTVAAILVGAVLFTLIAGAPRAGAVLAAGIGAVPVGFWLNAVIAPAGGLLVVDGAQLGLLALARWVPPLLVAGVIIWSGIGTAGRAVGAALAVIALWVGTAAATAFTAAVGSRVLASAPQEMLDYGVQVFWSALSAEVPLALVAAAVAALGLVVRATLTRRA